MSWDASIEEEGEYDMHTLKDWNYTHNCNAMMATVLEENGHKLEKHWLIGHMGKSWFEALDGKSGEDGAVILGVIVTGMEEEPVRFRKMNPPNGWGDYDRVLKVLREMLAASREYTNARWAVNG